MIAKPIVNRIEDDLEGTAAVVRYTGNSPEGKEIIRTYGVRVYPTFIVLDSCGELVGKIEGVPDQQSTVAYVEGIPACD